MKIEDCDILIGIFWRRFGTPVSDAKSGTEHEFRIAYEAWKKNRKPQIMVYFSQKPYSPKSKEETDQWGLVLQFKKDFPTEGLWWEYKGKEFETLVRNHLTIFLSRQFPIDKPYPIAQSDSVPAPLTQAFQIPPAPADFTGSAAAQTVPKPMNQQAQLPPRSNSRKTMRWWIASGFCALLIVLGIRLGPSVYKLSVNHFSPVVVPESHFVGPHGSNKKLIIFVHGVIGDMDNTWVNPETNASWPQLVRDDPDMRDFDVFVYGYASPAMGNASTIEQLSVKCLQQLRDFGFFANYTEVSFITHSMGGLITKRMLNMLKTQGDGSTLQKVRSVICISVPSNGANLAALASWISANPQFRSMSAENASDFLQRVWSDWANLLLQRTASSPFPRTYSAHETLPTGPVVVPVLYTSELSDGPVIGFEYNHVDIVKPKDRDSDVYHWANARLLEKVLDAPVARAYSDVAQGRKLLTEFDFRLSELDQKTGLVEQAQKPDDKGALLMYIWRAAHGDSAYQPTLPEFANTHWAGIVIQLSNLGASEHSREAIAAIRDLDTGVVTENGVALQSPGGYRLLPVDYLKERSKVLHQYSDSAWKQFDPTHN